jgi:large subunit ribosomal protein L25
MANALLQVIERTEKPKKVRKEGFTPGVIYGEGIEKGISIKFEMNKLKQQLNSSFKNAKVNLKLGDQNKFCIIKDFQREPVSGKIIHLDFQAVSADEIIKLKVPIVYNGLTALESRRLVLQINNSELEIEGKVKSLPESIFVDVGAKKLGDKININDLDLAGDIKVHESIDEILAVVIAPKEFVEENAEATETTEEK